MSTLFRMAYLSTASKPFGRTELRTLLKQANERNARVRLTGMLLHKDDRFMQVLEGPAAAVKAAFGRISRDPRHFGIIVLIKEAANERHFPGRPMAFRNLDLPEQREVPGYGEFLNTPLTGKEFASQPSLCERLLLLFTPERAPK